MENKRAQRQRQGRGWNILIVDDSLSDAMGPFRLIHHLGDRVTLCLDGKDALTEAEGEKFDLVILDWKMPVMSGRDFLKHVEANGSQPLRVVVYSGEEEENIRYPKDFGRFDIVDVWKKPLPPLEILRRLQRIKAAA